MKIFPVLLLLCLSAFSAQSQFQAVYIGVNGLTCSQCSRTVEVGLKKLDFVADVDMNLEHTEGKITMKPGHKADMNKIAQAVADAGFSLRYLHADLTLDNNETVTGRCFKYKGDDYVFTDAPKQPLSGTFHLRFIGKKFLSKSEFKKLQPSMVNKCGDNKTENTYYVTTVFDPGNS